MVDKKLQEIYRSFDELKLCLAILEQVYFWIWKDKEAWDMQEQNPSEEYEWGYARAMDDMQPVMRNLVGSIKDWPSQQLSRLNEGTGSPRRNKDKDKLEELQTRLKRVYQSLDPENLIDSHWKDQERYVNYSASQLLLLLYSLSDEAPFDVQQQIDKIAKYYGEKILFDPRRNQYEQGQAKKKGDS
ncbi:MAG: hypothetical protein LUC43_06540 [Burkholderiales bacterium]|nr:hypothetical protein [Burkholderiales bacterium]